LLQVSKDVLRDFQRALLAKDFSSEHSAPKEDQSTDPWAGIEPEIKDAIQSAVSQGLCKLKDVDMQKCRKSTLGNGKVIIFSKAGNRICAI